MAAGDGVKVTFGGKPCYQAGYLLDHMDFREYAKVDRFSRQEKVSLCTRFLNPLGQQCCVGYVLMKKSDLMAVAKTATNTLKIEQPSPLQTIEAKRLLITHAEACFNAQDSNDMIYIVEISDRRWFGANNYFQLDFTDTTNNVFNLPAEMYPGSYHEDSTLAGTPYTWQEMLDIVWPSWLSSTAPTLPYTPNGTPFGFDFRGQSPYEAVGIIMERLGCALKYVPSTGEYDIVEVGVADNDSDDQQDIADQHSDYFDDELNYYDPTIAIFPKGVSVNFHKLATQPGSENTFPKDTNQWLTGSVYTKTIDASATNLGSGATVLDGTYAQLWDELPCWVDPFDGSITNTSDLNARAQERCDKFYQGLMSADTRYRESYSVAVPFEPTGLCRGVSWRTGDDGEWITERYSHPRFSLKIVDGNFQNGGPDTLTTRNRSPILGPLLPPMYPYETAFVRIDSGPDANGLYTVTEVREDGSDLTSHDGISALAVNANP